MARKRSEYDENLVKRVARKLYEIFYAGKAYKKIIKPKKKKSKRKLSQTKRQKEIKATRLSRQSRQQLTDLSKMDYEGVMKILKGKK